MKITDQIKEAIRANDITRLKDIITILDTSIDKLKELRNKAVQSIDLLRPQTEGVIKMLFGDEPTPITIPISSAAPTAFGPLNAAPAPQSLSLFSGVDNLPEFPSARTHTPDLCPAFIAYTLLGDSFTLNAAYSQIKRFFNFTDEHLKSVRGGKTQIWQQRVSKMIQREVERGLLVKVKKGIYRLATGITQDELKFKYFNWEQFFKAPSKDTYPYSPYKRRTRA
jgi:hypothetical protein